MTAEASLPVPADAEPTTPATAPDTATPAPGVVVDATAVPGTEPGAAAAGAVTPAAPPVQARNPLHGLTLEAIVTALVAHYGWPGLAERVPVRCFSFEPSVKSSLKFLRRTPWAREKVEGLYLYMLREQRREQQRPAPRRYPAPRRPDPNWR